MKKLLLLIVFTSLSIMHTYAQVPTKKLDAGEFRSLGILKAKLKAPIKRMPAMDIKSLLYCDTLQLCQRCVSL